MAFRRFTPGLKKVYFPNIVFKLTRDPKLPPNQVAFRVPPRLNKLDIRDYLTNIYNINVVNVRTMNYQTYRSQTLGSIELKPKKSKYKKAIVTLSEEFKLPDPPDPMIFGTAREYAEMQAIQYRRLAGWKSRPKRLVALTREREKALEEMEKSEGNTPQTAERKKG
jgi:ribosomal protein L23